MSKSDNSDTLFAAPLDEIMRFAFDEKVAKVFDDMIQRSVPGYGAIISMIGVLAQNFTQANSNIYDLGSSLGAATVIMRHRVEQKNCRIFSVDKSHAMCKRCKQLIIKDKATIPVNVVCADISDIKIHSASVVVLNFTLQFIAPEMRHALLSNIYAGMLPGAILVLSEKVKSKNQHEQRFQTDMHHMFKRLNGYSELEISQKRSALDNVLRPDTIEQNIQRLQAAGFKHVYKWYQCFNFVSFVAIK